MSHQRQIQGYPRKSGWVRPHQRRVPSRSPHQTRPIERAAQVAGLTVIGIGGLAAGVSLPVIVGSAVIGAVAWMAIRSRLSAPASRRPQKGHIGRAAPASRSPVAPVGDERLPESSRSAIALNLTADQLHDRGEYLTHRLAELNSWLAAAENQKRQTDPSDPVQRPNIERLEHEIAGLQEDIGHVTAEIVEHDAQIHHYRRQRARRLGGWAGMRARLATLRS